MEYIKELNPIKDIETRLPDTADLTLFTITHHLGAELLAQYEKIIFMQDGSVSGIGHYSDLSE